VLRELAASDETWARKVFSDKTAAQLTPIFSTRIQRMGGTWYCRMAARSNAYSTSTVEHGDLKVDVCEIELELASEASAPSTWPCNCCRTCRCASASRAGAAWLWTVPPGAPCAAGHRRKLLGQPRQAAAADPQDAGGTGLPGGGQQLRGTDPGHDIADQDSDDIERLHQMRVGLRRLRSAFTLFDP
jgi:hypothetical protein